jgi:hypothetical protein
MTQPNQRRLNPELFRQLPYRRQSVDLIEFLIWTRMVVLKTDMTGAGDIPVKRPGLLVTMPKLEEEPIRGIEHENIDTPVDQSLLMDGPTTFPADKTVVLIDHGDSLFHI